MWHPGKIMPSHPVYVVTLRFADKSRAPAHMADHNAWLQRGFEEGVFLLSGSLQPNAGGVIIAHGLARAALETRLTEDPFVSHGVVTTDIAEIAAGRTDPRLAFLTA
ncbi:YciI family protein [Caulobacter flavus]|jgi:uncharacterized protein YciI